MEVSLRQAQSYIVESQLLATKSKLFGLESTLSAIEHLGYVQIDTISVIERAHHHVLWSRIKNYKPEFLRNLEQDGHVFEYWAHAASYLPMRDYRYSLVPKHKIKKGPGHWRPRDKKWTRFVYDRIKAEGPLMGRDFKKDPKLVEDHAWGGHPITQALRQLFMEGELMISGRKGFQKIYDLTERVLPESVDLTKPSVTDYYTYLIMRDIRANGLIKPKEIGHLISIPTQQLKSIISNLIEDEILVEVIINKIKGETYIAIKDQISEYLSHRRVKKLHILSPFDNLIIQRKRLKELFNFDYILECYVHAPKRKFGYFSLPLLWGKDFIGQLDLKADRKNKVLIIKNIKWEDDFSDFEKIEKPFSTAIESFSDFNDCHFIQIGPTCSNSYIPGQYLK